MKDIFTFLFLFVLPVSIFAQKHPESYVCYKTSESITVDGAVSESDWAKAEWSHNFVDIEGDKKPLPTYHTRVKMLWDEDYFYVAAELQEPHIWAKLNQRDAVIFHDNDFEVFIDPQGDNHLYYEFEMNALNTIWDLLLAKPYRDGAPAINAWDIKGLKSAVKIYGSINDSSNADEKWTVEIAFPWKVLKECAPGQRKPLSGEQWRVNFSRVNWDVEVVDGNYQKKKDPKTRKTLPEHNWVWSPQGVIAMHQPETWGYVQFSDKIVGEDTEMFIPDEDYITKITLIRIYQQEKKYFAEKGYYSVEIKPGFQGQIEITKKQFLAYLKGNSGKIWYINQESKLWSE
ncbi:carbohydrate-binding family 9-like protein [Ancylomarina longa]|uniref:Carbohydrate-binding family 9-like protein n=1 Tax=Ancylomarina longa TaxID=2487017 RepID=A0A434AZQ5_9BACT|nr:carbohydrate-binding family 9-like protein [Ancylomarina longa]RUT80101.1 carbohydrate-binding family 9-like protein [Ancylomarina longa]